MAAGARRAFGAAVALGVTGIAGPAGGTPEKPVGTVHLALDAADGSTRHERLVLPGDRSMVRRWTTAAALGMIRAWLMERGGTG
jgi:nicotinamide-nucleotide amidase